MLSPAILETSGIIFGAVIGQSLAGLISQPRSSYSIKSTEPIYISHWPLVHYIYGVIAVLFSGLWTVLVFSYPNQHPWISESEKQYLLSSSINGYSKRDNKSGTTINGIMTSTDSQSLDDISAESRILHRKPVPWRKIFQSLPVWSILICHVCFNWSFYTLVTSMPTYLFRVLGFSISEVTLGGLGVSLLSVAFVGCNRLAAVALFSVTIGLMGFSTAGYGSNALDLAPIYNGNIISITNTAATLPGIFGPLLVGYVTKESSSIQNWMIIFGIAAGIAWFGALMNLLMTSGEIQPWGRLLYIKNTEHNQMNRQSSLATVNYPDVVESRN
ncbi:Sialin [Schistosoma japonicum]|nr:Sialin [Schistosoma japonicum]